MYCMKYAHCVFVHLAYVDLIKTNTIFVGVHFTPVSNISAWTVTR